MPHDENQVVLQNLLQQLARLHWKWNYFSFTTMTLSHTGGFPSSGTEATCLSLLMQTTTKSTTVNQARREVELGTREGDLNISRGCELPGRWWSGSWHNSEGVAQHEQANRGGMALRAWHSTLHGTLCGQGERKGPLSGHPRDTNRRCKQTG